MKNEHEDENAELLAQNNKLRQALEIYADEDFWCDEVPGSSQIARVFDYRGLKVGGWELAAKALEETK